MKMNKLIVTLIAAICVTLVGCASVKGTVYKQKGGEFKATFSAKTEREALKVVHADAELTCDKDGKSPVIVKEEVISLTEKTEKSGEGFSAVAGSAVTALDKYFGSENMRATLVFDCE